MDSQNINNWSPFAAKKYDPLKAGSIDGTDTVPHDHAIIRALDATFIPYKGEDDDKPECSVFIGRLDKKTTKKTIKHKFSKYGGIRKCRLVRDIVTGTSKCYAFVEYESESAAKEAVKRANGSVVDGKKIFVDYECGRTLPGWIPRRLGGGFGGFKESGQLRFGGRERPFWKPIPVTIFRDKSPSRKPDGKFTYTYNQEFDKYEKKEYKPSKNSLLS